MKATFNLRYQVDCLERADRAGRLCGAHVLEVGGTLPEALVIGHYRAAAWTSVDNRSQYSSFLRGSPVEARTAVLTPSSLPAPHGAYLAYDGDASHLPLGFDGAFDVVMSIATFEHIHDLTTALRAMHRVLKPDGVVLAQVGPVWSGWRGHHIFPGHLDRDRDKCDDMLGRLIPWQHLVMAPKDMHDWVESLHGKEFADRFVPWVYESPRLNRLFYDEYEEMFERAGLRTVDMQLNGAPVPPGWEATLLPLVEKHHPTHRGFGIDSFWLTLEKLVERP